MSSRGALSEALGAERVSRLVRSQGDAKAGDRLNVAPVDVGGRAHVTTMQVTNVPAANRFLTKAYRPGFGV